MDSRPWSKLVHGLHSLRGPRMVCQAAPAPATFCALCSAARPATLRAADTMLGGPEGSTPALIPLACRHGESDRGRAAGSPAAAGGAKLFTDSVGSLQRRTQPRTLPGAPLKLAPLPQRIAPRSCSRSAPRAPCCSTRNICASQGRPPCEGMISFNKKLITNTCSPSFAGEVH